MSVEQLSVTTGPTQAQRTLVQDIGFQLERGQTLGIVGESGSGKSLTARAIVGLLPAGTRAHGSVTFDDRQLLGSPERVWRSIRGSKISLLLQDPFTMLNPLHNVGAHIAESLPPGTPRRERRSTSAEVVRRLAEVGLASDSAQRYPFELSGGMRQRVALAAALARDPELLIADEPTTALDVTTQDDVLQLLKRIQQRRGMALILITHDLRVAFEVCDRIQVMYAGSVVEQAPAAQLMTTPAHPYSVGLLLAEPPVTHYLDKLVSIPGNVPSADSVTDRCAFADRCAHAQPICVSAKPPLVPIGPGRTSGCVRLPDIRTELIDELDHVAQAADVLPAAPVGGTTVLNVIDLRKTYRTSSLVGRARSTTALKGVDFHIASGESVGLVGESGSGKTTIARSILGLAAPDSGTIELGDLDVSRYRRLNKVRRHQARRFVQVVFQDPYASLNPALTVGATLREVLRIRGDVDDVRGEVADLLARVGLSPTYADRRPGALSGGERQRVAIARAVAMRPRLLICDEPVAALDVSAQAQVLELLRDIRDQDEMSMLFITHDLSVVRQMTDRLIVLYHGEVVESGRTASILDDPRHTYTRRLLAAVPGQRSAADGETTYRASP